MDRNEQLFTFIEESPSPYHAVRTISRTLMEEGFQELKEQECWQLKAGGKYYVTRNGSSLIAFRIPETEAGGFRIVAGHSDSPCFKLKEHPEIDVEGQYVKLNVERYGGMIISSWMDRPLSVAGRVVVREEGKLKTRLVDFKRDVCMIPSLAVHMSRDGENSQKTKIQKEMLPLYAGKTAAGSLLKEIADCAGVRPEDILGNDLFLYNRMKGRVWGASGEYISSGRLDDLQCVFAGFQAFLAAEADDQIPVLCVYDNEEVGSTTRQGAASTLLLDTLLRINEALGRTPGQYRQAVAGSFMLSADNAHGVHPNYPEKACPTNRPYLNGGVVLKFSANQKYTTDAVSAALVRELCHKAGVPCQTYVNHSDVPGGSTLGNISANQVAVRTADVGLAQLAMHSSYETAGSEDTAYMIRMMKEFFQCRTDG